MEQQASIVLVIGSGPNAVAARDWPRAAFDRIVAINNAWQVRPDWTHHIHPEDFPPERRPKVSGEQLVITAADYVPLQNTLGGFIYAGGTMAFTAGYWALTAMRPSVLAFIGCDMVYPREGATHFYGTGEPDPLREDISLRNLEAKSARLMLLAAECGCRCVNLSRDESRLVFPRADVEALAALADDAPAANPERLAPMLAEEDRLGYLVPSGRYWEADLDIDLAAIDALDQAWLQAAN